MSNNARPVSLQQINLVDPDTGLAPTGWLAGYLTPPQIATAYEIPASTGAGIKVGIISFGGGFQQSDLNSSFTSLRNAGVIGSGVVTPTISQVLLNGQTGAFTGGGYDGENTVDIYCVATMVPEANITIYIGNSWGTIDQAIADGMDIITISWATTENSGDFLSSTFTTAATAKTAICVASGDWGSSFPGYSGLKPCYPSSSPKVISVGGTSLLLNNNDTRLYESDDNRDLDFGADWGGGGGLSSLFARPTWQNGLYYTPIINDVIGGPTPLNVRGVPDISAPMNLYALYFNGSIYGFGGTSLSAPVMAGILARMQKLSGIKKSSEEYNTVFYGNPSAFYDITVGTNNTQVVDGYAGTTNWDAVTGLGPPDGDAYKFSSLFLPPITSASSQTVFVNSTNTAISLSTQGIVTNYTIVSPPSHGSATASTSTITYSPTTSYSGTDSFTYKAISPGGTSTETLVSLIVTPQPIVTNVTTNVDPIDEGSTASVIISIQDFSNQLIYWTVEYGAGISSSNFDNSVDGSFYTGGTGDINLPDYIYTKANNQNDGGSWTWGIKLGSSAGAGDYYDTGNTAFNVNDTSRSPILLTEPYIDFPFITTSTQTRLKKYQGRYIALLNEEVAPFKPTTATSGIAPFTYSIGPALPTGLNFNTLTGIVSGTPTVQIRDIGYAVTATDSIESLGTEGFVLSVVERITSTSLISTLELTSTIPFTPFIPATATGGYNDPSWSTTPVLPDGIHINSFTGIVYGTPRVVSLPASTYSVNATDSATTTTSSQSLSITVNPYNWDVRPYWENTGSLGTILVGEISELYVKAIFSTSTIYPSYSITSGSLPSNLTLNRDGSITGQANNLSTVTNSVTSTSSFSVAVKDINTNILLEGDFSITVKQSTATQYTGVWTRPFLTQTKRNEFIEFIRNDTVFPSSLLYKPNDINFGKQEDLKIMIEFGAKLSSLSEIATIASENFYKRKFETGEIKTAVAKDADGNTTYEFIYVEIIDKHVDNKISMPSEITYNGVIYYPPSIPNMRTKIATLGKPTTVRNPSFTKFVQEGDAITLGYISYIPVCFTLPGKSATVIRKIAENGFKFNTLNIEIDRLVVRYSDGDKYLLLNRDSKLA